MSEQQVTPFGNRVQILSDLWVNYRFDEEFEDFFSYNDLGLPLAFLIDNKIANETMSGIALINETWDLFLAGLEIEDTGFETINDVLTIADE